MDIHINNSFSIIEDKKSKAVVEEVMKIIFLVCAFFAVLAVFSITIYMILNGTPAIFKIGLKEILFDTQWAPTAAEPRYGILYVILTSIIGTAFAVCCLIRWQMFLTIWKVVVGGERCSFCSWYLQPCLLYWESARIFWLWSGK